MPLLKEVEMNGRKYEIYYFTGAVIEEKSWSETEVSGSGGSGGGYTIGGTGYNSPGYVNIKSKTRRFNELILQDKNGQEQSYRFQDWDISCRKGNTATVLWAIPKGKKEGFYILVHNHQSGTNYTDDELAKMFMPGRFTFPLFGWNMSWWPWAALVATPIVWYQIWALVATENFVFGWIWLASPFIGYFVARKIARNIGARKANEYFESDREELMSGVKASSQEAAVIAE